MGWEWTALGSVEAELLGRTGAMEFYVLALSGPDLFSVFSSSLDVAVE